MKNGSFSNVEKSIKSLKKELGQEADDDEEDYDHHEGMDEEPEDIMDKVKRRRRSSIENFAGFRRRGNSDLDLKNIAWEGLIEKVRRF